MKLSCKRPTRRLAASAPTRTSPLAIRSTKPAGATPPHGRSLACTTSCQAGTTPMANSTDVTVNSESTEAVVSHASQESDSSGSSNVVVAGWVLGESGAAAAAGAGAGVAATVTVVVSLGSGFSFQTSRHTEAAGLWHRMQKSLHLSLRANVCYARRLLDQRSVWLFPKYVNQAWA